MDWSFLISLLLTHYHIITLSHFHYIFHSSDFDCFLEQRIFFHLKVTSVTNTVSLVPTLTRIFTFLRTSIISKFQNPYKIEWPFVSHVKWTFTLWITKKVWIHIERELVYRTTWNFAFLFVLKESNTFQHVSCTWIKMLSLCVLLSWFIRFLTLDFNLILGGEWLNFINVIEIIFVIIIRLKSWRRIFSAIGTICADDTGKSAIDTTPIRTHTETRTSTFIEIRKYLNTRLRIIDVKTITVGTRELNKKTRNASWEFFSDFSVVVIDVQEKKWGKWKGNWVPLRRGIRRWRTDSPHIRISTNT